MSDEHQGFKGIGNLASKMLNSRENSASIPSSSLTNFETTGARSQDVALLSSTGQQLIETAVAKLQNAIVLHDPVSTDQVIMASLPDSVRSQLQANYLDFVDKEYGYDTKFNGFFLLAEIPDEDRIVATRIVEAACKPAPKSVVASELGRLRALTKSRFDEGDEMAAAAYASELTEYPPDIVISALRHWSRTQKWWPSWSELRALLEERFERRKALYKTLTRRELR